MNLGLPNQLRLAAVVLVLGPGLDATTQMGPLANGRRRDAVRQLVAQSVAAGTGGTTPSVIGNDTTNGVAAVIGTFAVSMFPFILPSSSDLRSGLTVWDATSSHLTLTVMFFAIILIMPVVVTYTGWAFNVMRGKVTAEYVRENDHSAY